MSARALETSIKSLDETQLEQWVLAYVNGRFQTDKPAQRIGRKGQAQKGVDVHAVIRDIGDVGYQAKAYVSTTLTTAAFDQELAAAHSFMPPLNQYTVVTLNSRDAKLQEHVREATIHGKQSVSVLALEDLVDIASTQGELRKLMFEMVYSASDIEYLLSAHIVDVSSLPLKVLPIEADNALPPQLTAVEDWINAGMPRKALASLGDFTGIVSQSSRARLEGRAHFILGEYSRVVKIVEQEESRPDADASVLALGAHAAEELEDTAQADQWLTLALGRATERNRPDVVAAHVRIHAGRDGTRLESLERFSCSALQDPSRVASALGDAAAQLGDRERAAYWFANAREKKPALALGVEINEACSATALALQQLEAGVGDKSGLADVLSKLETLATRTRTCEVPSYRVVILNALGFVYQSLDRSESAAKVWDEALLLTNGPDLGLWTRRCVLSAHEHLPVPEDASVLKHAVCGLSRLVLASAFINTGHPEDARPWIQGVLDDTEASEDERAIALVEMLRLQKIVGERNREEVLEAALAQLAQTPKALPLLSWVVVHHAEASSAQQGQIRAYLEAFPLSELEDERLLALADVMLQKELGDVAVTWLPRIEAMAFDEAGTLRNRHAAELMGELCIMSLRYDDAIRVRKHLLHKYPLEPAEVQQYARALYESGDREGAYQALRAAIETGVTSSRMVLNWAMLSSVLGHRREAHRLMKATPISANTSPGDYVRLLQAQAILGVKGNHNDVLAGLRDGLMTADNAGVVFGFGLRRRFTRHAAVKFGTVLQLHIPDAFDGMVCIVEQPAKPLPGLHTLDAENHPWVLDLIGAHVGETVELTRGAFLGKQAKINVVHDATDWLVHQARDLIAISAPERTGVHQITGDIAHQIAITKKQLEGRRDSVAESMEIATAGRMPIAVLSKRFNTSAREFLMGGRGWTPTSHSGSGEDIAADDAALSSNRALVFDPVTVLLMFAIGAESLPSSLPQKPGITRQAAWQLFDWYALEREGRRASAHLQLSDDGKLIWSDYRAEHRVSLLRDWRAVNRVVRQDFELIDTPSLSNPAETAQLVRVLGEPMISGMTAAREGRVLISEEVLVRGAANHLFGAKAASLHRLIAHAAGEGWISRSRATLWLASLIRLGWTWVSFPVWMLDHALRMSGDKRWPTAYALLGRMRTAEPTISIQTLFQVLRTADTGGYRDLDLSQLRSAIFRALPRIEQKHRTHLAERYGPGSSSRKERTTRKMLARWAEES